MNKPMRKVSIALGVLFLALFVNLNFVQVVKGSDYRNDSRNQRVLLNEYSNPRGQIVVSGHAVATSRKTDDELKYLRVYPKGKEYAPVTGYYSFIYDKTGIENAENGILSGDDDRLFTTKLANLLTGRDPRGGSVDLTINAAAQNAAYAAMSGRRGAVVALDPQTGAILAAVSTPSYDPNKISSHDADAIQKAYTAYNKDKQDPMLNRAFRQIYPSGSVFKVIDSAAALSLPGSPITSRTSIPATNGYRALDPTNTKACSTGNGPCIENFDGETCDNGKTATLAFALAKSCNTAFAQLTVDKIGGSRLASEAQKFGLQPPYPGNVRPDACDSPDLTTPLAVCNSSPGSASDLAQPDTLAQTALGQRDVGITPLQGAMIASAVANNGTLMKPYLVAKELRPNLSTLSTTEPTQLSQVVDPTADDDLISMMEGVVTSPEGTGGPANITELGPSIKVGGKTGTADHCASNSKKCPPPHAWFTGFALDKGAPKIAVAVIIEDGGVNGNETTGGLAAGPVAKKVMLAYLRSIGGN